MLIAIPAFRLSCKVAIDKGRAWSVVDEMLLWASARQGVSIASLSSSSGLPPQIVVASLARLMRFRLVEVSSMDGVLAFSASEYGKEVISGGRSLPFFPKRSTKRVSFVIERVSGGFFPTGEVRLMSATALADDPDTDVRHVNVEGGGPSMSHEANLARLSQIAARGWEEQLASVDGRTSSLRDEFMVVRVLDGVPHGLPDNASQVLQSIVDKAVARPQGAGPLPVRYGGEATIEAAPQPRRCNFDFGDLVIGGDAQLQCLRSVLDRAYRRVIVHSTFLDHVRFKERLPEIRAACLRGVSFDLLWGAEAQDGEETKSYKSAVEIAKLVRNDPDLRKHFRVNMRSTGSHAKVLLVDQEDGAWIAAVGSCNWFSSPFRAVEITVVLRDQAVVSDVAVALQRLVGRRGLADDIATEMALVARELRGVGPEGGNTAVALVIGDRHDEIMRLASGAAHSRIAIGSHRLGSTARPGAVMPGEVAAVRGKIDSRLIYTMASGPMKNRHARKLTEEAAANGLVLIKADPLPLHGKFLLWDNDDTVVTSLNWASGSADLDFPQADIGVHLHGDGIGKYMFDALNSLFPKLSDVAGEAT